MALSDQEREILAGLESQLAGDAKFANSMRESPRGVQLGSMRNIVLGTCIILAGVVLLLVGISTQLIVVGVVAFVMMMAGAVYAFNDKSKSRNSTPESALGSSTTRPKSAFMQNLETKWEERRNSGN